MSVPPSHMLVLAAILFAVGAGGFLLRRNFIVVLMCVELMLNAANLTFLAGARIHSRPEALSAEGPLFAIFVIVVAAIEAAVGLALVIALYRRKRGVSLDRVDLLRG